MITVETNDKTALIDELKGYSRDVRYVDSKDELGQKDIGKRRLQHGIIRRCGFFGSKIGYCMRFETSQYKMGIIKKAVAC